MADYGELLPHVLFGDITRYAAELAHRQDDETLDRLLHDLDEALAAAGRDAFPRTYRRLRDRLRTGYESVYSIRGGGTDTVPPPAAAKTSAIVTALPLPAAAAASRAAAAS